ncbi:MAG: glutamine--tRNA ligase/YqeY domain fusion protein [Planctomycetota bacterium]|nr:MAG: glutamine--tRNA ligase/YqeY domain fusion protein [Planctomycetota bacterium]
MEPKETHEKGKDFIRQIIDEDIRRGKHGGRVHTRFPPEPNGYLHIGHAKAIVLNFEIAKEYGGLCNLRFDDTNPVKEDMAYVEAIKEDVKWLGYDWEDRLYFASDYFDQLYEWAVELIKKGKAYVCDLSQEEISKYRGAPMEKGKDSPYRNRSIEENLDLFERMKNGEFEEGEKVLRAKIDMSHPNINMRDPVIYRIMKKSHYRTGDKWCIYPMYDYTHPLSDSIEGITHSLCTLEFEFHRPLYDWFIEQLGIFHPQQIEFSRLNLAYTVMSKRKLLALVEEGIVKGWDDPRMPTLSGMRRRGYTPKSIRNFIFKAGISKRDQVIQPALLEHCVRDDLNEWAPRAMAVLKPLKVVITNWEKGKKVEREAEIIPSKPEKGVRKVPFGGVIYIEQDDFMEEPVKKFFRLAPGRTVKLRYAYYITCNEVIKDENGKILELRCTYSEELPEGVSKKKAKSILHWVSAEDAIEAEVRLYNPLFLQENPDEAEDYKSCLNPNSLEVIFPAYLEPGLKDAKVGDHFQFERLGYFVVDPDSTPDRLVFNRTVTLKDDWAKIQQKDFQK